MTRGERSDLERLINQRERVLKQMATARSAELFAEFDRQMAQTYSFDQDETWRAAKRQAEEAVALAQRDIAQRCAELGIPVQFAPGLQLAWHGRGENAFKQRREELRRVARSRIAAIETQAKLQIAQEALRAKTELWSVV